jgi:hypothetical protein
MSSFQQKLAHDKEWKKERKQMKKKKKKTVIDIKGKKRQ